MINLLPIVDDFERAFSSIDSHLAGLTWFDGMPLIYRKCWPLLENIRRAARSTLTARRSTRRYHEAVAHVEGEEGKVISRGAAGLHAARPRAAAGDGGGGKGNGRNQGNSGTGETKGQARCR